MSYCRWSSDDYQCDVYVYESSDGYETLVATRRPVFAEPLPPPLESWSVSAWMDRHRVVSAMLERATYVAIDLTGAGASYCNDTPGECADLLERLRADGFNVPQDAIDALRDDQAELDSEAAP